MRPSVRRGVRAGGLLELEAGAGAAVGRARLGLPVDVTVRIAGAEHVRRAALRLRAAAGGGRRRGALRGAVRAARRRAARPPVPAGPRLRRPAPSPASPGGQPPGLGARPALRRGGDAGRGARRRRRRRPHRLRSGRDRALPARRFARAPRPARHGRARGPARAPAARRQPRADGRPLRGARAAVARGRRQRVAEFARNRVRHQLLPALRSLHPAAEANVLRTLALLRDEASVLDVVVDAALAEPATRRRWRRWRRCRRRSRGWPSSASPRGRVAGGGLIVRLEDVLALDESGGARPRRRGRAPWSGRCPALRARAPPHADPARP